MIIDKCHNRDFVTLIMKVVDFCNFECSFCRYYQNKDKMNQTIMDLNTFEKTIYKAAQYNINREINHLTLIFHGGEPLLWGIENFEKAISIEKQFEKDHPGFYFVNNIQTNGSLIDDKWIQFFNLNSFSIGLSIDGPEELNFHKNAFGDSAVLKNIKLLNDNKCKYGILSVITNDHYGKAELYYEFLKKNNIHSVGFCYCFDSSGINLVSNKVLTEFLMNFYDLFFFGDYRLHVREFEYVMKLCLNAPIAGCTFDNRRSCGNYFTVFPSGNIHFCDSYSLDDIPLGNVCMNDFDFIKNCDRLKDIIKNAHVSTITECLKCPINSICAGGCFRHVINTGKNAFCETFKILYPHIKKTVNDTINNK